MSHQAPAPILPPGPFAVRYPAGSARVLYEPGDFILVHHKGKLVSKLIRFGQRLRFRGARRPFAHWNHAAMVVSTNGDLVEALGAGVGRTHISDYEGVEYAYVRTLMGYHDRNQAVAVAERMVGVPYGFLTIVSLGLSLLTGSRFAFGLDGQFICSGLVARCLEKGDAVFDRTPSHIMPADLAAYFNVRP